MAHESVFSNVDTVEKKLQLLLHGGQGNAALALVVDLDARTVVLRRARDGAPQPPERTVDAYANLLTVCALQFEGGIGNDGEDGDDGGEGEVADAVRGIHTAAAQTVASRGTPSATTGVVDHSPLPSLAVGGGTGAGAEEWGIGRFRTKHWDILGYREEAGNSPVTSGKRWLLIVFSSATKAAAGTSTTAS